VNKRIRAPSSLHSAIILTKIVMSENIFCRTYSCNSFYSLFCDQLTLSKPVSWKSEQTCPMTESRYVLFFIWPIVLCCPLFYSYVK
jgi:hypothetical protein